ncbi:MAG: nucleotide exchange factor GrpE [Bacteroidetes bacterium]|nr:MAG: nucleotide exchange factor GrpE [Bacteroidota bacterium]
MAKKLYSNNTLLLKKIMTKNMAHKKDEKNKKEEATAVKPESKADKRKTAKKPSATKKLKEELEEIQDKYVRLYSEFDNYRKRTIKERLELQKSAAQDLIVDLLPVLDDFERAMQVLKEHASENDVVSGVELIYNKLFSTLSQKGLEPMNSMGTDFNTDFHEAITNIDAGKKMKGKVVDVIQKGYLLNGKVLRFAKVVVGS